VKKNLKKGNALARKYCEKSTWKNCDPLQKICDGKEKGDVADACFQLGQYRYKKYGDKDYGAAVAFAGACGAGRSAGCNWADSYCQKGKTEACYELGKIYLEGKGVKADTDKGLQYLRNGCAKKHGKSCYDLGYVYLLGKKASKDPAKAAEYFKQACDVSRYHCSKYREVCRKKRYPACGK